MAFLVIIGESLGSLGLITGLLTRFTAASFIVIMAGAIVTVHWPQGFFMNWSGQQQGEGFEYHLLVIGMSAALVLTGGGAWSLDRVIARWLESVNRIYRIVESGSSPLSPCSPFAVVAGSRSVI